MLQSPSVSIVICTRNRAENLSQTLESLRLIDVPAAMNCELIVVDNGSTDSTKQVARNFELPGMEMKYIFEPKAGQVRARNTGLDNSMGDVILFTDDDVQPPRHWIAGMSAPILADEADAVAGGVRLAPHLLRPWMTPLHRAMLASTESLDPNNLEQLVGANMAFSRRVLSRVPRFDAELGPGALGFYDDTLFALQLREAGSRLAAALDVEVEHHPQSSRLLHQNYRDMATKLGRSMGYVSHHWRHETKSYVYHQLLSSYLRLKLLGSGRRKNHNSEGIDLEELQHLLRFHSHLYYLQARKAPPNYKKRGLVKLHPTETD